MISNAEMVKMIEEKLNELPISSEEKDLILRSLKNLVYIYPRQVEFNADTINLRMPDEESAKFKQILDSIKQPRRDANGNVVVDHGLILPISVRPIVGRPGMYALNDGGHRLRAWTIAFGDSKPIPAMVLNVDDEGVMLTQLQANVLSVKTDKRQLGAHCRRYLDNHPEMSVKDLADLLNVTPKVINDWMSLTALPENLQARLSLNDTDPTYIPATVGYVLSKFEPSKKAPEDKKKFWRDQQNKWLEHYDSIKNEEQGLVRFMADAALALKKIKAELKKKPDGEGNVDVSPTNIDLTAHVRSKKDLELSLQRVKEEIDNTNDSVKTEVEELVEQYKDSVKYLAAVKWRDALEYVLQVDEDTRKAREEEAKKKAEQKRAVSEEKRAGKKSETIARVTSFSNLFK